MLICGVLLAAGKSTRFGADKLLYSLPDGTPLAVAAARYLMAGTDHVITVVREADSALAEALRREGAQVVACERADEGMGASLACGVQAGVDCSGWLVSLADMPLIKPATVKRVAMALRAGAVMAAPLYGGRWGHPVGFGGILFPELAVLSGDVGGRPVVERHQAEMQLVPCEDPGIHWDVDTLADLQKLV